MKSDIELLANYAWPGNIRELQNVIERAVIISQGGSLRLDLALGPCGKHLNPAAVRASVLSKQEMQRREGENILKALEQSKGKIYGPDGAAQILGMKLPSPDRAGPQQQLKIQSKYAEVKVGSASFLENALYTR
jgi:transcriptional regulator with GAF, ATPase, and Fis domain